MFLSDDDTRVSLRQVEREDLPMLRDWRNQEPIRRRCREHRPLNLDNQTAWFEGISAKNATDYMFVVVSPPRLDDEFSPFQAGVVGITHVRWPDQVGELSSYIVHEDDDARRQASVASCELALEYAFDELGLHLVTAEVFGYHTEGLELVSLLEMTEDGPPLRDRVKLDGKRYAAHQFSITEAEWRSRSK